MFLDHVDEQLLDEEPTALWELFHENSKLSRHERHPTFPVHPSDATVVGVMTGLRRVKPYTDFPKVPLPTPPPSRLVDSLLTRTSARGFGSGAIELAELGGLLRVAYGVTRDNVGTVFPRPFRAVPSGGALYPLELYLHCARVNGLPAGLYHYDPEDLSLDALPTASEQADVLDAIVQAELARDAAAIIFVSAVFFRSTFKYGDRGYRFVLLEAGHLAQNVLLAATQLGLAAAPIGGYYDRDIDRYLGCNGVDESAVYLLLVGPPPPGEPTTGGVIAAVDQ